MTPGFCGWLGDASEDDAREILTRMVRASGAPSLDELPVHAGPEAALAVVTSPSSRGGLFRDDRCIVAWHGNVADDPDTAGEELARRYRNDGNQLLKTLPGPLCVAIVDPGERALLLASDRFGVQAVAYCETPTGIAFATNGRSLAVHPDVPREIDPQSIYDYAFFHMVPSPRHVFRGWQRLEPGECLRFRRGEISRARYWLPRYEDHDEAASEASLSDEFRRVMRRAVRSCVRSSGGTVGAFLSGGTDSSTVAGILSETLDEPVRAYSIGFDEEGFDETGYARIAARHFGLSHHEYKVTAKDVSESAPGLAAAFDQPFGNASAVASYFCARLARDDGVDVMFAGDGGDEIFAGNTRYAKQKVFEYYEWLPAALRRKLVEPMLNRFPENGGGYLGKAKRYVQKARVPLPDRLESYNFLTRMSPGAVFSEDFLATVHPDEPLELLRRTYQAAPTESLLHRLLFLDLKFTLADNDLRKVGRTCEMAGVGVRYPFLDDDLVDFANRVPPSLKLKGQKLRYFFKRSSEGFLPDEILEKSKHGFGVPCARWSRDYEPLREMAIDCLQSLTRRGYLSTGFQDRLLKLQHGEFVDYYGVMTWVLMMLELWLREHADGSLR